jgi:hypothetical protein
MKKRRRGSRNACQRRQRRWGWGWGWEWEGEGISERGFNSGRRRGVSVGTAKREREKKKGRRAAKERAAPTTSVEQMEGNFGIKKRYQKFGASKITVVRKTT